MRSNKLSSKSLVQAYRKSSGNGDSKRLFFGAPVTVLESDACLEARCRIRYCSIPFALSTDATDGYHRPRLPASLVA